MAPKQCLQSCCGCFSLRTGTLVAAVGSMILSALTIIVIIFTDQPIDTVIITLPQTLVKIIMVINLFMTVLISGLLILGVLKETKFYMLPWIILGIILIICLFISIILTVIKYYNNNHESEALIMLIGGLAISVIYLYMWTVVYNYYLKLREEERRLPYYKPPYSARK